MENNHKPSPFLEPLKWLDRQRERHWHVMKTAPLGVFAVFALGCVLGGVFIWFTTWHVIVPVKDAQLQSQASASESVDKAKDATIESKDATIQQLQTTLAVNGLNTFPLKKRASTLADQIDKFADNFATNDFRKQMTDSEVFGARFVENGRVSRIIEECDEQGAHIDGLDNHAPVWEALANIPTKPEAIHALAALLRVLAGKLKD